MLYKKNDSDASPLLVCYVILLHNILVCLFTFSTPRIHCLFILVLVQGICHKSIYWYKDMNDEILIRHILLYAG